MSRSYLVALLLTLLLEVPLAATLLGPRRARAWLAATAANLVSHPIFWFVVLPALRPSLGWRGSIWAGEALVWSFEALVYAALGWGWRRGLTASVAANALSYLFGSWIYALLINYKIV